ncbi:Peroxiredoxin [Mycena venus]|uniref:Putative peroxiredoxin n=1 Tax=Mycena venus TaxID=2733690 RepID=A0A8H7DCH3_9AGAR|nr:Peroxiredoxin [Mycena venus]
MAPSIKVGDTLPKGEFGYIPWAPELESHASYSHSHVEFVPSKIDTEKDWKGKKVVLFSVPGAFTPTCHVNHLPPFLEKYDEFKAKGVDVIAVIAANDLFVMSGWARFEGCKDKIVALSDPGAKWSAALDLSVDLTDRGLGVRTARYAMIIDDLVIKYVEVEPAPGVSVSGADAVLAKL